MKMEEIIIKKSKMKLIILVVLSLVFVVNGFWLTFFNIEINVPFLSSRILHISVGVLSMLFFGFGAIMVLFKLIENKFGMKITEEGIYDNSTSINSDLIKWENILDINEHKVFKQKFIRIKVNNPEFFIKRQSNSLKRKNVELNYKKYGSPIQITSSTLNVKHDELLHILKDGLSRNEKLSTTRAHK